MLVFAFLYTWHQWVMTIFFYTTPNQPALLQPTYFSLNKSKIKLSVSVVFCLISETSAYNKGTCPKKRAAKMTENLIKTFLSGANHTLLTKITARAQQGPTLPPPLGFPAPDKPNYKVSVPT